MVDTAQAHGFDCWALEQVLQCSFINKYLDMLLCLERVPQKLAAWAEGCECHQPFVEHLSEYMQRKLVKSHYGAGLCTCPMRGKRAPELANGKEFSLLQVLWRECLAEFMAMPSYASSPLLEESMGDLVSDFERGRSPIEAILRLKLDFWQRLPWVMCGMASSDPAEAQMCAQQARASFDLCPQHQAHHRLTWEVLDPPGQVAV